MKTQQSMQVAIIGLGRMGRALAERLLEEVFFDPVHAGWFTSVQAVKDVTLALDLAKDAPPPVTEAARDAYRQVVQDGWVTHDVTALVEYGRRSP
jgi:3-hydroxyisobutyrate dehydrogenase-like beta-hydroxyacid dehydrogenase